jgi:hypothetical protein
MAAAGSVGERDRDLRRQFSKATSRRDEEVADGLRSGKSSGSFDRQHLVGCRITVTFLHDILQVVRMGALSIGNIESAATAIGAIFVPRIFFPANSTALPGAQRRERRPVATQILAESVIC